MSHKNQIILILAQVEVNKILSQKTLSELTFGEKAHLVATLEIMRDVYKAV